MDVLQSVSRQTLKRLPNYLNYLKTLSREGNISSPEIAKALGLNEVQVRKDLSSVSKGGRPKIGYNVGGLISDITTYLGYDEPNDAVIVGVGNLGRALMAYRGFEEYGLRVRAGFDSSSALVGTDVGGKPILPLDSLVSYCKENRVRIGIIATPATAAQDACALLIRGGILALWNFAPTHITVPEGVLVQNENMASSLALLSKHLDELLSKEDTEI